MKHILKKIAEITGLIYGYGIMLSLILGGLTFFGYVIALILGGSSAAAICHFIYKVLYPVLVYGSSLTVLLGLLTMYLKGEKALSSSDKKKEN